MISGAGSPCPSTCMFGEISVVTTFSFFLFYFILFYQFIQKFWEISVVMTFSLFFFSFFFILPVNSKVSGSAHLDTCTVPFRNCPKWSFSIETQWRSATLKIHHIFRHLTKRDCLLISYHHYVVRMEKFLMWFPRRIDRRLEKTA